MSMSKKTSVYAYVGAWLIVMPLLGLPSSWKAFLTLLTGIALIVYEIKVRRAPAVHEDRPQSAGEGRETTVHEDRPQSVDGGRENAAPSVPVQK